jgi:hypothetical protein
MQREKSNMYFFKRLVVLLMFVSVLMPFKTYAASDTTPPTFNKLSVYPQEVTAGETVHLVADVTDDLSGVMKVNVGYRSTQSKYLKNVELTLNKEKGTFEGSFKIESNDASGDWIVDVIYLRDNQDNTIYIYHGEPGSKGSEQVYMDLSPYTVTVKGNQADTTPPKLINLSVTPNEVTAGETVKFLADVVDDLSGVLKMSISYKTAAGTYKDVPLSLNKNGQFEAELEISPYDVSGEWKVDHIYLSDQEFNRYFIYPLLDGKEGSGLNYEYRDLTPYSITVKGAYLYDKTPPTLGALSITPKEVTLGESVTISADVKDDLSGVGAVSMIYHSPDAFNKKHIQLFYNEKTGKYEGSLGVTKYDAPGEWKLNEIYLIDKQNNAYTISHLSGDKVYRGTNYEYRDLSEYSFKVVQTEPDVTPPTTAIKTVPSNGKVGEWYSSDVTVSFNSTDDISGVGKTIFRINGGDWNLYTQPLELHEGIYIVEYYSSDKAGNEEVVKSEVIKIDQTAPYTDTSKLPVSWTNSEVIVSLNAWDKASGVAFTEYRINGGEWSTYKGPIVFSEEGRFEIDYRSVDMAGNVEVMKSFGVKMDQTNPLLDFTFDQSIITDKNHKLIPIKVAVKAEDSFSGIASLELVSVVSNQEDNGSGDGNTTQDIQEAEIGTNDTEFYIRAETTGNKDRIYTITYKATDYAGNIVFVSKDIVVKATEGNGARHHSH